MNVRTIRFSTAALAAFALSMLAPVVIGAAPAEAVVYCKAVGVPKGCVARPKTVVVHPTTTVIYCTAPGVPLGCVVRPTTVVVAPAPVVVAPVVVAPRAVVVAPRAVVVPRPYNRGGPVNRVGRR